MTTEQTDTAAAVEAARGDVETLGGHDSACILMRSANALNCDCSHAQAIAALDAAIRADERAKVTAEYEALVAAADAMSTCDTVPMYRDGQHNPYCFTHHQSVPCMGDDYREIRAALRQQGGQ